VLHNRSLALVPAIVLIYIKKQKNFITKKREFIDIASKTTKALNDPVKEDDEYDIIGKRFAMQLRGMKEHQMFLAEKIIGDDLCYCIIVEWRNSLITVFNLIILIFQSPIHE